MRDVAADAVTEIADGILPPEVQFDTLVADGTGVHVDRFLAGDEGRRHFHDQVVGKLGVPVQRGGKAVPEEAGLETGVKLLGLFPGKVFVREFAGIGCVRDVDAFGQLIIAGALGDGGSILIVGKDADVTVDAPAGAELQEGEEILVDALHPRLVGDGPTGGNGREAAPAVLGGELRGVERVGTEGSLDEIAVVVTVSQTAEIGQGRRLGTGAGDGVDGVVRRIIHIPEVRLVALQGVGRSIQVYAVVFDIGHTAHRVDLMLPAQGDRVVEEVLPLVAKAVADPVVQVVCGALHQSVQVVRSEIAAGFRRAQRVTETGGEGESLERRHVRVQGAVEVDILPPSVAIHIDAGERVVRTLVEHGGSDDFTGGEGQDVEAVVQHHLHIFRDRTGAAAAQRRRERIQGKHRRHDGEIVAAHGAEVVGRLPDLEGVGRAHLEPVLDLVVGVQLEVGALERVAVAVHHAVIVQEGNGRVVGAAVVGSLDAERVALGRAARKHEVEPVGVDLAVPVLVDGGLGEGAGAFHEVDILPGVQDLGMDAEFLDGVTSVVEDLSVTLLARLGGDDDDAVTGLGAVNGGRGGVLEDFDALDILRVHRAQAGDLQTVDDVQRIAGVIGVRRDTADTDGTDGTGISGGGDDLDTGRLARESGGDIVDGAVFQRLAPDGSDGAGDVALLLDAVADDDGLFQHLVVLFHEDGEPGLVADGDFLLLVADGGNDKDGAGLDRQPERAVRTGDGAVGRTLFNDAGSDHRTRTVADSTADSYLG